MKIKQTHIISSDLIWRGIKYWIIIIGIFCAQSSFAQINQEDDNSKITNQKSMGDSLIIAQRDTLSDDVNTFGLFQLFDEGSINDTILSKFHEYDISREQDELYITTGNIGSSAFPIFYRPSYKSGYHLGHRQYDIYKMCKEEIRFYNLEKAYSLLYFTPGASQQSFTSGAKVGRDFKNQVKLSIDFQRINSESIYVNQEVRHTAFQVGVFQRIPNKKWAYAVNFLSNSNFENLNGGISDPSELVNNFNGIRTNVPVYVNDAYTYHLSRRYQGNVYYFLQDRPTTKQYLSLELAQENTLFKTIDNTIGSSDSLRYGATFIPNELGIRYHQSVASSQAVFSYHLNNNAWKAAIYGQYSLHQFSDDLEDKTVNDAIAGIKSSFQWRKFKINVDGFFGVSDEYAIMNVHPRLSLQLLDWLHFSSGFIFHVRPPDEVENRMVISNVVIYNERQSVSTIQEIYGKLSVPKIGLSVKLHSVASQNVLYFNHQAQQIDAYDDVNYIFTSITERYQWRWLEIYGHFAMQFQNQEVYGMPEWYTRGGIAYSGELFKDRMLLHAGVNVNYFPEYNLPSYQILTSQLYSLDGFTSPLQYRLDAHISLRVKTFKFFIKYENLASLWTDEVQYQIAEYPQFDGRLRFGVSWALRG